MKKSILALVLVCSVQSAFAANNCKSMFIELTDKLERVSIVTGRSRELSEQLKKQNIKNEKVNEVSTRESMLNQVNLNGQEDVGVLIEQFNSECLK